MTHTTVTYKGTTTQRLDMRWLTEVIQQSKSIEDAKKHTVLVAHELVEVGELFDVSGDAPNKQVVLENANQNMDYVGYLLPKNIELNVKGSVGHYAGASLSGGKLNIEGDVQNFAGCDMSKGLLNITQNAGDYLGGAYAGNKKGMSGGTVLVHGNSGNFTGDLMRRGTIMVVANIGDYCGSRMIAGSIANLGTIGKQVGVGMKRGTILLPHKPKDVITGFHDCGRHSLGYLTLLLHELRSYESTFQSLHPMRRRVQRYLGDTAVGGQGEMLIWIG